MVVLTNQIAHESIVSFTILHPTEPPPSDAVPTSGTGPFDLAFARSCPPSRPLIIRGNQATRDDQD